MSSCVLYAGTGAVRVDLIGLGTQALVVRHDELVVGSVVRNAGRRGRGRDVAENRVFRATAEIDYGDRIDRIERDVGHRADDAEAGRLRAERLASHRGRARTSHPRTSRYPNLSFSPGSGSATLMVRISRLRAQVDDADIFTARVGDEQEAAGDRHARRVPSARLDVGNDHALGRVVDRDRAGHRRRR